MVQREAIRNHFTFLLEVKKNPTIQKPQLQINNHHTVLNNASMAVSVVERGRETQRPGEEGCLAQGQAMAHRQS